MKKSTLNKDIWLSFRKSKGRFISIMCLMMLGSFALVGLKVASPDIERSVSRHLSSLHTMDLAVLSDYGLSKDDQAELNAVKGAQVEYGYFTDTVLNDSSQAIRVYSQPKDISKFKLVAGSFPKEDGQVALLSSYQGKYQIGDSIELKEEGSGQKILRRQRFKISGFVNSPELGSKENFGNSTAGNGTLSGYALVKANQFDSSVYTLARLRFDDVKNLNAFSQAYQEKVAQRQKDLEDLLADNGKARLGEVKSQAKQKLSDGQAEIAKGKQDLADAEQQLADGQTQIQQKETELKQAQSQLAQKETDLSQAAGQLAQAEQTLASSKAQLDAAASQLAQGQAQLEQQKAQLDAAAAPLSQAQARLAEVEGQIASGKANLDQEQAKLAQSQAALQAQIQALQAQGLDPSQDANIQAQQEQLAQAQAQLDGARSQLAEKESQLAQAQANYQQEAAPYQAGLAQYQAAQATLANKQADYQAGLAQYQTGLATLNSQKTQYQTGQVQLAQSKEQLAQAQGQIETAQTSLDEKKADFAKQKEEAEGKLKKAQSDLDKAQDELAGLVLPQYHVYNRRNFPGDSEFSITATRASGISAVGNIFPVVLYLVAALVTMTTMTRFVNEERINAGVLKALGYHNPDIIKKFVTYGLVAGLVGTILGILAGTYFLPYILGKSLFESATYPPLQLDFYWGVALLAILCSVICSVLPALHVARKELKEAPSQLLLPKPPTQGASILLEKLSFIWRRLTFTQKVTARNIFRYKQRMLMTIFGVAGSVALLFAGLGISSSLGGIAERQFGQILQYHIVLSQKNHISPADKKDLERAFQSDDISAKMPIYRETLSKKIGGVADEQTISLFVSDQQDFSGFIELNDKDSKQAQTLSDQGALVSEKLAQLLKVSVGDVISVKANDGSSHEIKVAGISEMYAGHFIFMNQAYYKEVFDKDFSSNAYLLKLKDPSDKNVQDRAADLMKLAGMQTVVQNTGLVKEVNQAVDSLSLVMQILTLVSILLALVILYNLTNINVAERIRELSTIKVLGFHNKEVTLYIYRETIALSLIGILVGLLSGKALHRLLLNLIGPSHIMFNPDVSLSVYLAPVLSILLILLGLGFMVNYTLRRVDMLEALKSVD